MAADSPYSVDDLVNFKTPIREYVEGDTDSDAIAFPPTDPSGAYVPEPTAARRMRLNPDDFKQHGFTKDCPGCGSLRDGTTVHARRNHTHRPVKIGWRRSLVASEYAEQQPDASASLMSDSNRKMFGRCCPA